jgi:hypothetical protein
MLPLDKNCQWCHIKSRGRNDVRWDINNALCGCGACHQWAHANPNEFGVWFAKTYPDRNEIINRQILEPLHTWKEDDYKEVEEELLYEAKNIGVDYLNMPQRFRMKLKRKLEELRS